MLRAAGVLAGFAAYSVIFFPAWSRLGENTGTATILPIIAAGWYFGVAGGLAAALCGGVLLNYGLISLVAPDPGAILLRNILSIIAGIGIGGATGWVRQVLSKVSRQARRIEQRHARALLEAGLRRAAEEQLLKVNATLEKACDEAVRASDEKSRFLARASHELRTPLAAIQGYGELLLEEGEHNGAPPATLTRDLGRIVEAARHLTGLVDELLDISRIETGQLDVQLTPTDLRSLVEDVAALMQPAAAMAGTRLRVSCAPDLPLVRTDARRARQVLLNLLSNAIKFTGDGDVEMIATCARTAPGEWAEIEVRDTGPGMTVDEQQLAFEEFWRGRTDKPGAGLGLSIARRLCRELGGSVDVSAAPGAGAAFIVRLPVAASATAAGGVGAGSP
jgi:signal transduction histidine kinase